MICKTEAQLKKDLSLYGPRPVTLLCGSEPVLVVAWRRRILEALKKAGGEIERHDGKTLDPDALTDAAMLLPMLGGRRILWVDGLEPSVLSQKGAETLLALLEDFPEGNALVITPAPGVFEEPKKGKTTLDGKLSGFAKKLVAAADKGGVAACLDRRDGSSLRAVAAARCKKASCELTPRAADLLLARCGTDMGALMNECDKLCAFAGGRPITPQDVEEICPGIGEADLYGVAKMLLKRDADGTLREISRLLANKTPPSVILASLGSSFCELSRAAAARSAGKGCEEMAKDLRFRFPWQAKKAYADCARFDASAIRGCCAILCEAETTLKTDPADQRVLLETAVVRCLAALHPSGRRP